MNVDELVKTAKESLTVRRTFGDVIERDGLLVIPVATVGGGLGAGSGRDPEGQEGAGGGFGMTGRPVGVYVLGEGTVSWRPVVDVNRVASIAGLLLTVYLMMRPRLARVRSTS